MLNPMDKLFTAWKSYFIVMFTDKRKFNVYLSDDFFSLFGTPLSVLER